MQKARKKKILAMITCLCVCLALSLNTLTVSAVTYIMSVPYTQPSVSDTQGYLNIFGKKSNGDPYVQTWFWSITPYYGNIDEAEPNSHSSSKMGLNIDYSGKKVTFTPSVDYGQHGVFTLYMYDLAGNLVLYKSDSFTSNMSVTYSQLSSGGFTVDCVVPYGNLGTVIQSANNPMQYTILYAEDSVYYQQINDLTTLISQMQGYLSNIQTNTNKANLHLSKGVTSLENLEAHALTLLGLMEDNNLKLDSIDGRLEDIYSQLILMSGDDADRVGDFAQNSDNQSDQLNDMNNQLVVDKPNEDTLSSDVDSNIDYDSLGVIGATLTPFMSNEYIVKMMLASLSLCLVGYIFFGKRG